MPPTTPAHIKTGMRIVGSIVCAALLFLGGVYVGYQNRPAFAKVVDVVNKEEPVSLSTKTDFAPFWKAWSVVDQKFPGADTVNAKERMYGAIKGMLASFDDPYTTFFTPEENKVFETQISGEFSGIGIEIGEKDGVLTVIAPLKGTPAEKAGIKAGDKIVKIGDEITAGFDIDHAIDLIRGTAGTPVSLTIVREGTPDPLTFKLTRATITLPTVDAEKRPKDGVFIISLYNFSAHSASLFRGAFQEYINSGYTKLLVDLRGNPGGYLDAAVNIASLFVPEGSVVVKEIGKSADDVTVHNSKGRPLFPKNHQLIILVDNGSASASEILAGALSEHGIGTLVGTTTFGKGSVQEVVSITPDTSLKVTVAKWYTPKGVSISDSGLTPKIKIEQTTKAGDTVDEQLENAIKQFTK
jgi:carboxyl-terminal processing protease